MLGKDMCATYSASLDISNDGSLQISAVEETARFSCRAFRLIGSKCFLFLKVPVRVSSDKLSEKLRDTLENGITRIVEGRESKFEYFGCTESSIKSGQIIYFNHDDAGLAVDDILSPFGDLEEVYREDGPGKYAARLGLSFSSTIESIDKLGEHVIEISDVYAENGICTTDGCGIIRESCARIISSKHSFSSNTSVFQIRRGGIKGLLVAYPDDVFDQLCDINDDSDAVDLAYRPSMRKYTGGPTDIEIHGISEPAASSRLNHAFIVLLLSLGVKLEAFEELLKAHLRSIEVLAYDRQEALRYIRGDLDAQGESFYQDLFEMLYAGHAMEEPFVRKKLHEFQHNQYSSLKKKLNIKVPKSCYVYGVVDEQGVLADDEIYLNLPHRDGVVIGNVLIARSPSYKPEDMRKLSAVNRPELYFLTNCVVFPKYGRYSIPASMSGGDLDGDTYFVCWEPTLLPPSNAEYLLIDPPSPLRNHLDWSQHDLQTSLIDLFVQQHHNSMVAFVSAEWQRVVERYDDLANSRYCRLLAEVVEEALDILKTGNDYTALGKRFNSLRGTHASSVPPARFPNPLDRLRNLIPDLKPTKNAVYYVADPALKLCRGHEQLYGESLRIGKDLMKGFNMGLAKAIKQDEAEGEKRSSDLYRYGEKQELSHAEKFKNDFLIIFYPESSEFLGESNVESYIRASAWYEVGYEAQKPCFAWLGARYLNQIKAYETNGGRPGLAIGALSRLRAIETPAPKGTIEEIAHSLAYWTIDGV